MSDALRRVTLVYSRVGGGHLSAARALAEELESTGRATASLVDAYLECGRFPLTRFPSAYARLARDYPRLWRMVYYGSNHQVDSTRVLRPFLQPGLSSYLERERPDLVVSVLPAINGVVAETSAAVGARREVVMTDWHDIHRLWVAPGVQQYTAPTESARQDCIRFGVAPDHVEVVGIPVRRTYSTPLDQQVAREQYLSALGLDPRRFTILAMVGAEGSPRALRNISRLAQLDIVGQMVVICGRNERLRTRIQRLKTAMPVRAVGFVTHVAELMRSADVLVTKAGGLTLAEAFCSGVAVVIHDVLPGQEAGNLALLLKEQAAEYAPDPAELVTIVGALYRDSRRRTEVAESGRRLARPYAARDIVRHLLERLEEGA